MLERPKLIALGGARLVPADIASRFRLMVRRPSGGTLTWGGSIPF